MMTRSDSEWDQRILCSDGNCIGIIGADGRCKTCGLPYDGQQPLPVADSDETDDTVNELPEDEQTTESDDHIGDEPATEADASDDPWADRTLCIDGSCIGIIGPDGRCKECGKPYPG
jgi:rubredoxin